MEIRIFRGAEGAAKFLKKLFWKFFGKFVNKKALKGRTKISKIHSFVGKNASTNGQKFRDKSTKVPRPPPKCP